MDHELYSLDLKPQTLGDLEFLDKFWGIIWEKKDLQKLKDYLNVKKLHDSGKNVLEISETLSLPKSTISNWIYESSFPPIVRLAQVYNEFDNGKESKLLSINSTRGGLLIGPWVMVPDKINKYKDILRVINQLSILPETYKKANDFSISKVFLENNRALFFAYLLGVMIGDAGKYGFKRSHRFIRRVQLKLSKKDRTNERFGEFLGFCINSLGLRYSRCKDVPPSRINKFYFYSWNSQSSLFFTWIMEACFGLYDKNRTSYDSIKADWILDSPRNFRIWFLQGVADSDGYIDLNTAQVGIVSKPNINFLKEILDSLDVKSKINYLHKGDLFSIRFNLYDAYKLPVFNPYVKLYRYNLMEKFIEAKKFNSHWPEWLGKEIDEYIKQEWSSTKIMHTILNKYNIIVRTGGLGKRIRKYKDINNF